MPTLLTFVPFTATFPSAHGKAVPNRFCAVGRLSFLALGWGGPPGNAGADGCIAWYSAAERSRSSVHTRAVPKRPLEPCLASPTAGACAEKPSPMSHAVANALVQIPVMQTAILAFIGTPRQTK